MAKKIICGVILPLLTLFLIVICFFSIQKESILANYLAQKTGVDVSIDKLKVNFGLIAIENLKIANPSGYLLPYAIECKTISLKTPFWHYFLKNIEIEQVWLDQIAMSVEFKDSQLTRGNWSDIIANLDTNATSTIPSSPIQEEEKIREMRRVKIDQLLFTDIVVSLVLKGETKPKVFAPIERIELRDVDSSEGLPTEELTEIIIKKLMEQISILQGIKNMLINAPANAVKTALKPFKILFGKSSRSPAQGSSSPGT